MLRTSVSVSHCPDKTEPRLFSPCVSMTGTAKVEAMLRVNKMSAKVFKKVISTTNTPSGMWWPFIAPTRFRPTI